MGEKSARLFSEDFDTLTKSIEGSFLEEPGPGALPEDRDGDDSIHGILVPNDDYRLSGYAMAWAYKEIAQSEFKDVYVVLGHRKGDSRLITSDIHTPLGVTRTDKDVASSLVRETGIYSEESQDISDSIGMQIPFLQYASRDRLSRLKILCIETGDSITEEQLEVLAHFLKKILAEKKKTYTIICSSNLTEFGDKFGYKPFIYNVKESIENIDFHVKDDIEKNDWKDIIRFVKREKANIPGFMSIVLAMMLLQDKERKFLQYYRSDYIEEKSDESSSYLSMMFL